MSDMDCAPNVSLETLRRIGRPPNTLLLGSKYERAKKEKQFQEAEETAADARGASERILAGLKKERGVLEAEIEHVRAALKDDLQKLQRNPREILIRLSPEQFKTLEKIASNGDVEALIRDQITFICEYASTPK